MTLLGLLEANASAADSPLIVALIFGLAGAFYLGIYLIHRIRRRNAILKRHLRAEVFRVPDSTDADRPVPKPYQSKLAPLDAKALPRRVKHRAAKRRFTKTYKCKTVLVDRKALPRPGSPGNKSPVAALKPS